MLIVSEYSDCKKNAGLSFENFEADIPNLLTL